MNEKKDKFQILTNVLNIIIVVVTSAIIIVAGYIIIEDQVINKEDDVKFAKENDEYLDKLEEVLEMLQKKYYGDIDMDEVMEGAIYGMLSGIDDVYTRYVDEEEFEEMLQGVNEEYTGLGIHVNYDTKTGGIIINNVMPNSPAEKQGLEPGDIIIQVDDLKSTYETYYDCVNSIKATEPKTVHIKYLRNGEQKEGDFTTEIVVAQSTVSKVIDNNIGYLRLYSFENGTYDEFTKHYNDLRSKNIKGLVIDLRNNPGGLVSEVYSILSKICPKGIIVKMIYKDGTEKVYENKNDNKIDIPLVVLVNENSASASEIFAGAVKDLDVGEVIGTTTFGKGIVQSVEKLDKSAGALSITIAKYYTQSGIEIHKNGIEPDVKVDAKEEYKNKWYIPYEEDLELQKAVEVINATKK